MVTLDRKDLIKYPFLKESQQYIAEKTASLDVFLLSFQGRMAVREALEIIEASISFTGKQPPEVAPLPSDPDASVIYIAAYPLTRILLSCLGDRSLIEKTSRYLSWIAYIRISEEEPEKKRYIRRTLDLPEEKGTIPVNIYLEISSRMTDSRWRLVNRIVEHGQVQVTNDEIDELFRERLRYIMSSHMPMKVPKTICETLQPVMGRVADIWQKKILEEFGSVEESAFPPCIQAIIQALASHTHLTHMGRFAVTAFLHNIGMENTRIVEIYGRVPDFNLQKTMYQVEHISGRGGAGTEYTSPQCNTMKTHSLCIHPDQICSRINHPLQYYKIKKKGIEDSRKKKNHHNVESDRPQSGSVSDHISSSADNTDKEKKSDKVCDVPGDNQRKDKNQTEKGE